MICLILIIYNKSETQKLDSNDKNKFANQDTNAERLSVEEITTIEEATTTQDVTTIQETTTINNIHNNNHSEKIIAINAGHQRYGNSEKEPIGPGASKTKSKVSSGTAGVSFGLAEYKLTFIVGLKLKEEILKRNYNVIMIRETNDVNFSNFERAEIANQGEADAFIRIHADGFDNSSVTGMMTICPTEQSPYCSQIYSDSNRLANSVLNGMVNATSAKSRGVPTP